MVVPSLPQHEKLIELTEDVVARLVEESKIAPASVALARLQTASLRVFLRITEPTPSDLISLVDTSDLLIEFVSRHADTLYTAERLLFQTLKDELTGVPSCRRRSRSGAGESRPAATS